MAGSWNGTIYVGDNTNDTATGTDSNESLLGNEGDDSLSGAGGNDFIDGGVGSDNLNGGAGNDRLVDVGSIPSGFSGIIGRDTLRGEDGDDILEFRSPDTGDFAYGGAGIDTVILDFRKATAIQRVELQLGPNTVAKLNDANTVALLGIERVEFIGGLGDDFVSGGALNDRLTGGLGSYTNVNDGNDTLNGMGGDDWIEGGTGIQLINGGAGNDTASFDLSASGGTFTIVSGNTIDLGSWGSVRNVENLRDIVTSTGNDVFRIDQSAGVDIASGGGNDRIIVSDGGSSIDAGWGDDFIRTGAGSDDVTGGSGADTIYLGAGNDLADSGGASRNSTEADTVYGEAGNDAIYTDAGADLLDGGDGDDTLYGGAGADVIEGGEGNDTIRGEAGADRIAGGNGNDSIETDYDYWSDTTPADADRVDGGDGNDSISGGRGLDVLLGGAGDDRLTVNPTLDNGSVDTAIDKLNGGVGIDTLQFTGFSAASTAALKIILGTTTDVLVDGQLVASGVRMEALDVSAYGTGAQKITGGAYADIVRTGNGDDVISSLGGDDNLQLLDYGGTDSNTIKTGAGQDTVNMYLGGNDSVDMGSGNDSLTLSNVSSTPGGLSHYEGGTGTDILTVYTRFGAAGITFDGVSIRAGDTVIGTVSGFESFKYYGSSEVHGFLGTQNDDYLEFGTGNDTAEGRGGKDVMLGGVDSDTLDGGAGDDRLTGGAGQDSLTGGSGADTFIYLATSESAAGDSRDSIVGFEAGIDTIDLSAIFSGAVGGAFTFLGAGPFTAAGQVRATQLSGDTLIELNTFGSSGAEAEILLKNFIASTLVADDFNL